MQRLVDRESRWDARVVLVVLRQLKACLEREFGAGYDYTYLYPGLQKVVQAAGRVIRTEQDEGVVYLIDDRFTRREVRELLPAWWDVRAHAAPPLRE